MMKMRRAATPYPAYPLNTSIDSPTPHSRASSLHKLWFIIKSIFWVLHTLRGNKREFNVHSFIHSFMAENCEKSTDFVLISNI